MIRNPRAHHDSSGFVPTAAGTKLLAILTILISGAILVSGCAKPSAANIALRKQNAQLQEKVDQLETLRVGDAASMKSYESSSVSTAAVLPNDALQSLFTTHSLKLGRLTGADANALKVYVVPVDQAGDQLKASGSFVVDAFDLSQTDSPHVGHWEFPAADASKNWYGAGLLYTYVLNCPFEHPPTQRELTIKISFTDALTRRTFETQQVVKPSPSAEAASVAETSSKR